MLELSLHILDIAENSVRAGASEIRIDLAEDTEADILSMTIRDDGCGMNEKALQKAMDPFYTTKKVRRVGLGLPMLAQAAERTGGTLAIASAEGEGTTVSVTFGLGHLDRQPLGNIGGTMVALIAGSPHIDVRYEHRRNSRTFCLDTKELKQELDDVPIENVQVLQFIREQIEQGLQDIGSEA